MAYGKSVAIVGISGLFPGAATLADYWQGILTKKNQSRRPPAGRWLLPADQVHNPRVGAPDCVYSDRACFLDDEADPAVIPGLDLDPDWLARLDPMFRLLLRVGQQTLADGGDVNFDRSRAGVIIGNLALPSDQSSALSRQVLGRAFAEQLATTPLSLDQTAIAPINQYVAGMPAALLARALKFSGTCFTLDAACASSLYAVKLAVDELLSGRADAMLAGGLSRPDSLYTQMGFAQLRALSPTGICAPFARSGNGLVVGEGCGLLLLKRTRDAVRDGDRIYAVIRGIGLSNDQQGNLLAPASEGQLRAMRAAYRQAGWQPTDVDLIECHATGTPVGDAVEFASLRSLWPESGWRPGQCVIGSVKGNIGHLLTAAGAAALIKTLLALQHDTLPPLANFDEAAPGIDLESSPFRILQQPRPWEPRGQQVPRRAAVSAFGFGGINAHLLLEEWLPAAAHRKKVTLHPTFSQKPQAIAVVGMAAHFGPWSDTDQLLRRIGGGATAVTPQPPQRWWGTQDSAWLRQLFDGNLPHGHFVPAVTATAGEFRIPPTEQAEMLPRQLLMLKVAAAALADAGATAEDHLFSGVFIGCGLDLQATNFSFRWGLAERAVVWAQELGLNLDSVELSEWIAMLRDAAGPPLTANRTMGALGSIVASRIAKEFSVGGPSFTISSEENSALRALETGIHLLQEGSINRAIVGAVDLAGDLRAAICRQQITPFSPDGECRPLDAAANGLLIGEGAGALVLKRLDDARQDGDRIHAVISGIGTAIGGAPTSFLPSAEAYVQALQQACAGVSGDSGRISYIETDGSGDPHRDGLEAAALNDFFAAQKTPISCWVGSVKADIGHAGGAAGMAALIKTILCLQQRLLPPVRRMQQLAPAWNAGKQQFQAPEAPQYWLHNRSNGPRRALVNASGYDGTCSSVVLEEHPGELPLQGCHRPLGALGSGLFVLEGASREEIGARITALEELLQAPPATAIDDLAQRWYRLSPADPGAALCLAIVAADSAELAGHLRCAADLLRRHDSADFIANLPVAQRDRVFFTGAALGRNGRIAFVFPGSGNHFAAMGRDLSALWPEIYAAQEQNSSRLADQYLPTLFWNGALPESIHANHNALVISHVAVCTALHDLLRRFGLDPQLISGYSLGESAGLFSSGAWQERDAMVQRLSDSTLFTHELAGECRAARRVWGLPPAAAVDWLLGIVNCSAAQVKRVLAGKKRVYLLIINSYREVVIGGQRCQVEAVVKELDCHFIPLRGVTTVHCEVTRAVADDYRNLHLFRTTAPRGIDFYSCALARKYPLTAANAADAILAQALDTIDYPQVVEQLYADGARIFLEVGPGSSCSRMIGSILEDRPHLARSFCNPGQDATLQLLRLLAHCLAERVAVDLAPLYRKAEPAAAVSSDHRHRIHTSIGGTGFAATLPEQRAKAATQASGQRGNGQEARPEPLAHPPAVPRSSSGLAAGTPPPGAGAASGFQAALSASADAHAAYLSLATTLEQSISRSIARQLALLRQGGSFAPAVEQPSAPAAGLEQGRGAQAPAPAVPEKTAAPPATALVFDRSMCLEFAVGSVAAMLGAEFAEVDSFPTRVRLPDEPLMLVDRIVALEGKARSMSSGRVVTEHDVTADRWYLDGGRIPTCVAVEAGQADLFLSGYLGIDFITRGKAVYRLLDAVVTFHRGLPVVGETIRYDIRIERFFRQDQTYLFRFNFEATVAGEPLLSMRNGCAGFFSAAELAAGRGIVHTRLDQQPQPGRLPDDWRPLVAMAEESYSDEQINALYAGDLGGCFGSLFAALPLQRPYTLPGGQLKLVDRVISLDPHGGRYGLGRIVAEMDIVPDAWFLTCHFVDDRVMPGTLMYECCMHTLRIYLLRMGWIGESGTTWCEPVPGVDSGLKCRGQVIETTRKVTYQVSIKELGYRPEPYAIVDALMFADGHPIVEIPDMSVRLAGLDRDQVEALWSAAAQKPAAVTQKTVLFDTDRITAFAIGNPSAAFGDRYRVFDHERRIARLPGPPFQFLDRIVAITGAPWKLAEGAIVTAEYDVPADAWYFTAGRSQRMPFSVLLEVALQPCGWLAAYLGSALTSPTDLSFRNLDGQAVQHRPVTVASGTLTTQVELTRVASSAGMIIQGYRFSVSDGSGPVYSGTTLFGFFSAAALAEQVGIRAANPWQPSAAQAHTALRFAYPQEPPFADSMLRMVDEIELYSADGGPQGLGFIRGSKKVDRDEWFFKAHFYQDPVCPGSLGLESFLQLLQVAAARRWGVTPETTFETVACGEEHSWNYRGQIIPTNERIVIEAVITAVDDAQKMLHGDGFLIVDGKVIYQMKQFSLRLLT